MLQPAWKILPALNNPREHTDPSTKRDLCAVIKNSGVQGGRVSRREREWDESVEWL